MSTNKLEGFRNVGRLTDLRRKGNKRRRGKPLVAELDFGRINITSTRLRESVTATIVEDKPTFDLQTINNSHFSNESS